MKKVDKTLAGQEVLIMELAIEAVVCAISLQDILDYSRWFEQKNTTNSNIPVVWGQTMKRSLIFKIIAILEEKQSRLAKILV